MDRRYSEIAEANFTVVLGGHRAVNTRQIARQLELRQKYDLIAIVWRIGSMSEVTRNPELLPEHPACWGYHLKDEPGATSFPGIAKTVAAIRKARPGKLSYVNLFPNAAGPKQLFTDTYEDYIRQSITVMDLDMISMNHYPAMSPTDDTRDEYCTNLAVMRRFSVEHRRPFWNFFNAMRFGGRTDPTEGKIRWQIYTSLAYGAKGIFYFSYWTPTYDGPLKMEPGQFAMAQGMIDLRGRRTRRYEQAKRINAGVKHLGRTLLKLTSTGVYRVIASDDASAILKDTPIETIGEWVVTKGEPNRINHGDYLIGTFRHAAGSQAEKINNYHYAHNLWPTVVFRHDMARIKEVCPKTGEEIPLDADSPRMKLLPNFTADGVRLSIELVAPGETAALTGLEQRQKPMRLIDDSG